MASALSWLAYSETQRRRALDLLNALGNRDTRDELGIGAVRDAFADMLFPGTSTIQTRAKYFLFVPWTYTILENARVASGRAELWARKQEIALIDTLLESDDTDGVIGKEAKGTLQRLPSNIYWLGLKRLGIRQFGGSQSQYHRFLDGFYHRVDAYRSERRAGNEDGHAEPLRANWHPGLPSHPPQFPKQASLRLTSSEAEYLRERILTNVPGTLFAYLVGLDRPFARSDYPWQSPALAGLPAALTRQISHARMFSELMNGASLLYNLMLAEKALRDDLTEEYEGLLSDWRQIISDKAGEIAAWDRQDFWQTVTEESPRIDTATKHFINSWLDVATTVARAPDSGPKDLGAAACELIRRRERSIKRDRARLYSMTALQLWNEAAGTAQLNYRWRQAERIILDVLDGLTRGEADA